MKCANCSKKSEIPYQNGDLCKDCFLNLLVKRIRKEIRTKNPFSKDEKVLVEGKLAAYFLKKAVEDLPLKIKTIEKIRNSSKYDKIVVSATADDEAESFFEEIMKKNAEIIGNNKKIIKIFKPVLDSELVFASKTLKIPFKAKKRSSAYEKMRKRNPNIAFGLVKSKEDFVV